MNSSSLWRIQRSCGPTLYLDLFPFLIKLRLAFLFNSFGLSSPISFPSPNPLELVPVYFQSTPLTPQFSLLATVRATRWTSFPRPSLLPFQEQLRLRMGLLWFLRTLFSIVMTGFFNLLLPPLSPQNSFSNQKFLPRSRCGCGHFYFLPPVDTPSTTCPF